MTFAKKTWANDPSGGDPITAAELQRIEDAVKLNDIHALADGSDHADVATNTTHITSDGKNHSDVVLNNSHRTGDGSDHGDVATNTSHISSDGTDHANVGLNDSHRTGDGSDHGDVATNTSDIAGYESDGSIRAGSEIIASGATCVIDWSTGSVVYKHTVTENVVISLTNLPAGAWAIELQLTNGGAFTVSYDANWKEAGGTALSLTSSGTDTLLIRGIGSTATAVIIKVTDTDIQ